MNGAFFLYAMCVFETLLGCWKKLFLGGVVGFIFIF